MGSASTSVFAVAVLLVLAGCTSGGEPSRAATDEPASGGASGGGDLVVTVTTSEIAPVEAALVQLQGAGLATYTDTQGRAFFTDLEAGRYLAVASKAGYRAIQEEGRFVDVIAGEPVEVRLQLDPLPSGNADVFHITHPQAGFVSCAVDVRGVASRNCARGVFIGPTHLGDPSDKTIHHWMVESEMIRGVLTEATWTANQEALAKALTVENLIHEVCNPDCGWYDVLSSKTGTAPLRFVHVDGPEKSITKRLGTTPQHFPQKLHTLVSAACPDPCQAAVMVQQRYEMWTTVFYGVEPDAGFTRLPA